MSKGYNLFIGRGHLGRTPVVKENPTSGQKFAFVDMAADDIFTSAGKKVEITDWIPLRFSGKTLEAVGRLLHEGQFIGVEGSVKFKRGGAYVQVRKVDLLVDSKYWDPKTCTLNKPKQEPAKIVEPAK